MRRLLLLALLYVPTDAAAQVASPRENVRKTPIVRATAPVGSAALEPAQRRQLFNGLYESLPEIAGRPAQPVAAKLYPEADGGFTICGLAMFGIQPYGAMPSQAIYDYRDTGYFVIQVSRSSSFATPNASEEAYRTAGCRREGGIALN